MSPRAGGRDAGTMTGPPGVFANGTDLLIVWGTSKALVGMRLVDGKVADSFGLNVDLESGTAPVIAGNLVVFQQHGNLYGTYVTDDFSAAFPIAASGSREESPRILQTGENRWFVAYSIDNGPDVTLAGRFITIEN
jgi:hypothetical protein